MNWSDEFQFEIDMPNRDGLCTLVDVDVEVVYTKDVFDVLVFNVYDVDNRTYLNNLEPELELEIRNTAYELAEKRLNQGAYNEFD